MTPTLLAADRGVDVREAAGLLGVSRSCVYSLLRRDRSFPRGAKLGRRRVWLISELLRFIETRSKKGGK